MRRWLLILSSFLFLLAISFSTFYSPSPKTEVTNQLTAPPTVSISRTGGNQIIFQNTPSISDGVLVTRVVDGDTIEIEGGQKVRYIGVNTPETVDPRRPVQCYGKEASNKNKEL